VHILPPWWQLWWVLVLEVLLLLAVIFLMVRFIIQRKLKEKESELARVKLIHAERERISRDMHDDLGSGLTQITIISELLKQNMPEEIKTKQLQKISETAGELVDNMGNLVWAMNPGYDSISSLLAYLREFCGKLFDNSSIQLEVDFPFQMEEFTLSPHSRKNIFLAVKESLNNSLKYSQASSLKIAYYMLHSKHIIVIEDNGIGFNLAHVRKFGNGIHNIQKRLKDIDGEAQIWSEEGNGTRIQLEF
jgi:signal transduction histidine kinase